MHEIDTHEIDTLEETGGSEPRLMIGELLRVEQQDDDVTRSYYCRIENISDRMLEVTWPTEKGVPLSVHPNQMLNFSITYRDNAYSFGGLVEKAVREPLPLVTVMVSSTIQRIQRREYFRGKYPLPLEVVIPTPETEEAMPLHLKTHTYDLSANGVSLIAKMPITEGAVLKIKFSLPDGGPPVKMACRVVHCLVSPNGPDKFHIGTQFLTIDENSMARIVRFINRMQLKRVRQ